MFSHTVFGGKKDKWLIAFYGYGQSHTVYEKLYDIISDSHNILVIDNPMHDYKQDIHLIDFKNFVADRLSDYAIQEFQSISYSMGSRLNLYLPYLFPKQVKKIIIVAPDGITFNFWNRVAISTPWGRWLFKFFVDHGSVYMKTLTFFNKIGIVNKSMYAFSKWNMRDDLRRKNVYNAWMNMRFLRPNLKTINSAIEDNEISLISYFGKNDPVIPLKVQKRCVAFFPKATHRIVDSDHNILNEHLFTSISNDLTQ